MHNAILHRPNAPFVHNKRSYGLYLGLPLTGLLT